MGKKVGATPASLRQGYLVKEPVHGHALSASKRRFFLLTEHKIEWYDSSRSIGATPKGYLFLQDAAVFRRGLPGHESDRLSIVSGRDELVLRLGPGNMPDELDGWQTMIDRQIQKLSGPSRRLSSRTSEHLQRRASIEALDLAAEPEQQLAISRETAPSMQSEGGRSDGGAEPAYLDVVCNRLVSAKLGSGKCNSPTSSLCSAAGGLHRLVASEHSEPTGRSAVRSPAASEESVGSVRAYERLRGRMGSLAWRSEVVGAAEVKAADLQGLDLAVPRSRTASLVPSAAARTVDGDARERSSTTACAVGGTDGTQSRRPAPSTRLDACPRRGASSKWGASSGLVSAKNARTNAEVAGAVATAAPVSAQSEFAHPHRLWEGYLVKEPLNSRPKGNLIASARRRFFVLTPDAIEWHESDEVGSVPKGYLLLRGAQVYRRGLHGEELALTSGGDELLMRLAADSPLDALDKWEAALRTQINALTERDAPGRGVRRSSVEAGERISTRRLSAGVERRSRLSSGGGKRTEMVWASPPVSRHSCAAPLEEKSLADSGCLWQGYLIKDPLHGNLLSQARRRFFLLTPVAIEWYESQEDVSIAKGNLRLRGAQVYRRGLQGEKLVLTSGADELVMRKGVWNRPEELDEWEAAIRKQIDTIRRGSDTVTAEVETVRIASASAEAKAVVVDAGAPSRSAAGRGAVAVTPVVVSTSPEDRGTAGRGDQARIDVVQARVARSHRRMEERAQHQLAIGSVGRVDFKKAAGMIDFSTQLQLTGVSEITGEEEASVEVGRGRKILSKVHGVGVRGPAASCDGGGRMKFADFGLSATVEDGTEEAMPESQVRKAFRKVSVAQSGPSGDMARDPLWVGFGLELVGMSVNEEEEAALDTQSKAALRSAYDLLAQGNEDTLSLELRALLNAHMQGLALSSCVGFGLELAGLQLSTAEESMLDLFSRSALSTARVLLAHADLGGTGLAAELEAAIDTQARRGGVPSSWLGFGLELAQMNVSEADQAALDPQSRAALDVGILLHERLLNGHRLTPDETGRALGVPFLPGLDSQGTAWLEFGLELTGLELNDEEVAQLEWQSAAALRGARLLRASDEYRTAAAAAGVLRTSMQNLSPLSRTRSVTREWLHWGKELYALGLGPEEEEGLDSQSKAALGLVRLLALRETETLWPDNTSAWVDLGLELSGLELSLEEEAALDALSRAALAACRVLEVRWMDDETQRQRGIKTSAWIELGMQLVGMSGEAEMELDPRSKAALQASRIVQNRQREFCAANGPRVSGIIPSSSAQPISMAPLLASHQLEDIEVREAPLDKTKPKARVNIKGKQTPMHLKMAGVAICGEELEGTHETEAPLDARQRGVPRRVKAAASEESGIPTRDATVHGVLAVQMESLPTSESLEIEAPLDASVRRAPKFSSQNCGQWAMTEGLSNMVEKEAPLDARVSGAGKHLAHQHAEPSSTEEEPLDFGTEAARSWLSFAAEIIDSIDLTLEEEAVLDSHTRQALQMVRKQRANSGSKSVLAAEGNIAVKESLPDVPVKAISPQNNVAAEDVSNEQLLQHQSRHRYEADATSKPWLSFGLELAEMDLSAEEESVLEPQVRAALHVARAVCIRDMSMIVPETMSSGQARRGAPRLVGGPGRGGNVLESEQEAVAGAQGRRGAPRLVSGLGGEGNVLESEQEAVSGGQARRGAPRLAGGLGGGGYVLESEQEAVACGQGRRGAPRLAGGLGGGGDVLESEQEAVAGGQGRRGAPRLVCGPGGGGDVLESEQEAVAGGQGRRGAPRLVGGPEIGGDNLLSEQEAVAGGQARRGAPRLVGGLGGEGNVQESEQEAVAGGQARRGAPRLVSGPVGAGDVLESEQEAVAGGQARRGAPRLVSGPGGEGNVLESEQEVVAGGQGRRGAPRLVGGPVGGGDVLESEQEVVAGGQARRGAPRLVGGLGGEDDLQEYEAMAEGQARRRAPRLVGRLLGGVGLLKSEQEALAGGRAPGGAPQLVSGPVGGGDMLESEQESVAGGQARRGAPRLVGNIGGVGDVLESEQEAIAGRHGRRGAPGLVGGPVGGAGLLQSEQEAVSGGQGRRGAPRLVGGLGGGGDVLESEQEALTGGQGRRGAPRLVDGPGIQGDVLESEQEAVSGGQARRGAPQLVGGLGGEDDLLESQQEALTGGQGRRGAPRMVDGPGIRGDLQESEQEASAGVQARRGAPRLVGDPVGGSDVLESAQEGVTEGHARRGAQWLPFCPGKGGDQLESEQEALAGGQGWRGAPRLVGGPGRGGNPLEPEQEAAASNQARLEVSMFVGGPGEGSDLLESEQQGKAYGQARRGQLFAGSRGVLERQLPERGSSLVSMERGRSALELNKISPRSPMSRAAAARAAAERAAFVQPVQDRAAAARAAALDAVKAAGGLKQQERSASKASRSSDGQLSFGAHYRVRFATSSSDRGEEARKAKAEQAPTQQSARPLLMDEVKQIEDGSLRLGRGTSNDQGIEYLHSSACSTARSLERLQHAEATSDQDAVDLLATAVDGLLLAKTVLETANQFSVSVVEDMQMMLQLTQQHLETSTITIRGEQISFSTESGDHEETIKGLRVARHVLETQSGLPQGVVEALFELESLAIRQKILDTVPHYSDDLSDEQLMALASALLNTYPDQQEADIASNGLALAQRLLSVEGGAVDKETLREVQDALKLAQHLLETHPVRLETMKKGALEALVVMQKLLETRPLYIPERISSAPPLRKSNTRMSFRNDGDTFDSSEERLLLKHVRWALSSDIHVGRQLKENTSDAYFYELASQGVLLAKFANFVQAAALDIRALNLASETESIPDVARIQNHRLCLNAATAISCGVRDLAPQQMASANENKQLILELIWNLTKAELLTPLGVSRRMDLSYLLQRDEDDDSFARLSAEEVLLRWVNHHVAEFMDTYPDQTLMSPSFCVVDLESDLVDSVALAAVLHQVSSTIDSNDVSLVRLRHLGFLDNLHKRATHVVEAAKKIGVEAIEIQPEDIINGRPRVLLAFVAAIFARASGPFNSMSRESLHFDWAQREVDTYHAWLRSLGIEIDGDLFEECKTGLPLLYAEDFLKPGCVRWDRVIQQPRSIWHAVENCNMVCEVAAGSLSLVVQGIDGKDIADGRTKLVKAMLWQLMRLHSLKILMALGVNETEILGWANSRVHPSGALVPSIKSFSDPALQTGVVLLELLAAIAPECVSLDQVLPGFTADERKLNAAYTISCAHKMGCMIFATWEDLVELQPKAMLLVFAAAMQEDMRRQRTLSAGEMNDDLDNKSSNSIDEHETKGCALM